MRAAVILSILCSVEAVAAECQFGRSTNPYEYPADACPMPGSMVQQLARSVVGVEFINSRGDQDNCFGVLLKDGFVLTAGHCTPVLRHTQVVFVAYGGGATQLRVQGNPPPGFSDFTGITSEDLALIDIGVSGRTALLGAGAEEARIETTDRLKNGSSILVHQGSVVVPTKVDMLAGLKFEYLAGDLYFGASGSPIFSSQGKVVGIHARLPDSYRPEFKTGVRLQSFLIGGVADPGRSAVAELAEPTLLSTTQDQIDERYVRMSVQWPVSGRLSSVRNVTVSSSGYGLATTESGSGSILAHTFDIPIGLGDGTSRAFTATFGDPFPQRRSGAQYSSTAPVGSFAAAYPVINFFTINQATGSYTILVSDATPVTRAATMSGRRVELCVGEDCDWRHEFPLCSSTSGSPCSLYTGGDPIASWNAQPNSQQGCSMGAGSCFYTDNGLHAGAAIPLKWFIGYRSVTLRVRDTNSSVQVSNSVYFFNPMPSIEAVTANCFCQWGQCSLSVQGTRALDWNENWSTTPVLAELAVTPIAGSTPIQSRFSDINGSLSFSEVVFPQGCSGFSCYFYQQRVTWQVFLNESGRLPYTGSYDANYRKALSPQTTICNGAF